MGYIAKLKPDIVRFIFLKKHQNPDISCRQLSQEINNRFKIRVSKSSVNSILSKENLSCPAGRRPKKVLDNSGVSVLAGVAILRVIDSGLDLTNTASEILIKLSVHLPKILISDVKAVIQSLIIYSCLSPQPIDFEDCYNNLTIWRSIGKRPSKTVFNLVVKEALDSQLFAGQLVKELRHKLRPIAGFRFKLRDGSNFLIDAQCQAIWDAPVNASKFPAAYYLSADYIDKFFKEDRVISIFNVQGTSIFSPEALNFIMSMGFQNNPKQIERIDMIDLFHSVVETKTFLSSEKKFFMIGFWPWQIDIMAQLERNPANHKMEWSDLGVEFFYQIEELFIPQHLVLQAVKLSVLILRDAPASAARVNILTNIPRDLIHNFLSYKELYRWFSPEERFKDFTKKTRLPVQMNLSFSLLAKSGIVNNADNQEGVQTEDIFNLLGGMLIQQLIQYFLPIGFKNGEINRIKEMLLKLEVKVTRGREFIVHNLFINNELCDGESLKYLCQQLNTAGVKDSEGRFLWFK